MIHILLLLTVSAEPELPSSLVPPKALKQRFDKIVQQRMDDSRPDLRRAAPVYTPLATEVKARLEAVQDNILLISMPVSRSRRRWLLRRGMREVLSMDKIGQEALMKGRHYRRLRGHKTLQMDRYAEALQQRRGQAVRLQLVRSSMDAHLEVVSVVDVISGEHIP